MFHQDNDNTTLHLIDVKTPLKIKVKDLIELYATHEEFVNNYGVESDFMYSYVWFPDDKHHMMFIEDFYEYAYEYHLEEYVYLFEYTTTDESLSDLLNEVFDELIHNEKQSISFAEYLINIFPPIEYDSNKKRYQIPTTNYLVLEMIHLKSYDHYSGAYEYDFEYNVIGYLDKNLSSVNKMFEWYEYISTEIVGFYKTIDNNIVDMSIDYKNKGYNYVIIPDGKNYTIFNKGALRFVDSFYLQNIL